MSEPFLYGSRLYDLLDFSQNGVVNTLDFILWWCWGVIAVVFYKTVIKKVVTFLNNWSLNIEGVNMLLTLLAYMLSDEPKEKEEEEYEYSIDHVDMGIELEQGEKLNETND